MAKYCNKCGQPLIEGQPHICPKDIAAQMGNRVGNGTGNGFQGQNGGTGNGFQGQNGGTGNGFQGQNGGTGNGFQGQNGGTGNGFQGQNGGTGNGYSGYQQQTYSTSGLRQGWIALMNRMGIGDPESNSDGVYERGQQIVPDNLSLNEGEIPIRQYNVAVLRSRMKFERAEGRLQVTNKRLLFRATGRSVRGKTTLQHEFALDDIKGFEIRKDYCFSFLDLLGALIAMAIVGALFGGLVAAISSQSSVLGSLFGLILGVAGVVPFFALFRRFFLKVLTSAAGAYSALLAWNVARMYAQYRGGFGWSLLSGIGAIIMAVSIIILVLSIFLFSFKPNLVFDFKTMGGGAPIQIRKRSVLGMNRNEFTGFSEVLPAADTERALREVGALINDIQKMGDQAIERWRSRP